jgi:hypothetical protein
MHVPAEYLDDSAYYSSMIWRASSEGANLGGRAFHAPIIGT